MVFIKYEYKQCLLKQSINHRITLECADFEVIYYFTWLVSCPISFLEPVFVQNERRTEKWFRRKGKKVKFALSRFGRSRLHAERLSGSWNVPVCLRYRHKVLVVHFLISWQWFTVLFRGVRPLFGPTGKSSPWGNFSDGGLNQSIKRRLLL